MPFTTQTQFNELPAWMQQPYQDSIAQAQVHAKEKPVKYPRQRLADINPNIARAHQIGTDSLNSFLPLLKEAESMAKKGQETFPMHAQQYMNPYQQNVIDQIAQEGNRNFTENVLPALEAKFVRLGQHGSSRHANLASRAARDLQSEIMNRQSQAMATGYQQAGQMFNADRAKQLEASGQLANLGSMKQAGLLSDIAMLENQGKYQQQQEQAGLDTGYQDFLRQQEHPMQRLAFLQSMLSGLPTDAFRTNQAFTQTPATPQMNVLGQMGSLAGNIWGSRMMRS